MNVTREVISDLWPLYACGEASADTRALVDEFLVTDPRFADALAASEGDPLKACGAPSLPPGHDLRTLDRIKKRLRGYPWVLQMAVLWSGMSFGRIVSDTSWDVSPRNFIITASIAAVFWVLFFVGLYRGRRKFLMVRLR